MGISGSHECTAYVAVEDSEGRFVRIGAELAAGEVALLTAEQGEVRQRDLAEEGALRTCSEELERGVADREDQVRRVCQADGDVEQQEVDGTTDDVDAEDQSRVRVQSTKTEQARRYGEEHVGERDRAECCLRNRVGRAVEEDIRAGSLGEIVLRRVSGHRTDQTDLELFERSASIFGVVHEQVDRRNLDRERTARRPARLIGQHRDGAAVGARQDS